MLAVGSAAANCELPPGLQYPRSWAQAPSLCCSWPRPPPSDASPAAGPELLFASRSPTPWLAKT